jgi:hypothetical protein
MRPTWKSTLVLFLAGIVLLALSGIGQPGGYLKDGPAWIGNIGWFGMLAVLLLLIASGLYAVVLRMRRGDQPLPH